jgi:hypothetical protein
MARPYRWVEARWTSFPEDVLWGQDREEGAIRKEPG